MGLFQELPAEPTNSLLAHPAAFDNTPVISSNGSSTATANRLKKSCTVAAANARSNSRV